MDIDKSHSTAIGRLLFIQEDQCHLVVRDGCIRQVSPADIRSGSSVRCSGLKGAAHLNGMSGAACRMMLRTH